MGEALANMAHAEDQARGGEIVIDHNTYQAAQSCIQAGKKGPGRTPAEHYVPALARATARRAADGASSRRVEPTSVEPTRVGLRDVPAAEERAGQTVSQVHSTVDRLDALVPYLPPGLLDLLRFDPRRMAGRERGEFRPVTVAFANFYGIEEIIHQLGPSRAAEITAILNAHFCHMQQIIDRYGGVIDKVDSYAIGHRIMALFGAPRAHVDDPERAVRAAWEMQAAMSAFFKLETTAGVFALKQRIGINTGRVFAGNVGSDLRHEYSVMGDEVNLTARLMSVAREGQVLISQSTAEQIGPRFTLDEQAPVTVKGKSRPVPNYDVRGHRGPRRPTGSSATGERRHRPARAPGRARPGVAIRLAGSAGRARPGAARRVQDARHPRRNGHGQIAPGPRAGRSLDRARGRGLPLGLRLVRAAHALRALGRDIARPIIATRIRLGRGAASKNHRQPGRRAAPLGGRPAPCRLGAIGRSPAGRADARGRPDPVIGPSAAPAELAAHRLWPALLDGGPTPHAARHRRHPVDRPGIARSARPHDRAGPAARGRRATARPPLPPADLRRAPAHRGRRRNG